MKGAAVAMSKLTQKQKSDRELINHPEDWPVRNVLPLRRSRENDFDFPEVGFIIYNPDWPLSVVYQDNVCVLEELAREDDRTLRDLQHTVYSSVTAMLLDGWEVD